jgi:hypothetical protein
MLLSDISPSAYNAIDTIERSCSILSLVGCAFIAITFLFSNAFHKPINRLVFYASLGNIFTNVATLISRASLSNESSFLCQFQGLLIQTYVDDPPFVMLLTFHVGFYLLMRAGLLQWL